VCCWLWTLCHTIQHRAVLMIFQTITITPMLSSRGDGKILWNFFISNSTVIPNTTYKKRLYKTNRLIVFLILVKCHLGLWNDGKQFVPTPANNDHKHTVTVEPKINTHHLSEQNRPVHYKTTQFWFCATANQTAQPSSRLLPVTYHHDVMTYFNAIGCCIELEVGR